MTVPTNTVQTYGVVGNREDLADVIYDISPTDTPFLSRLGRESASNTYHEWQTDALAAAAANRKIEGDDAAAASITPTVRVGNYCQISEKTIQVSGTQRKVNAAGRADEYSRLLVKAGLELKRKQHCALAA